jgi:hypothetical protein
VTTLRQAIDDSLPEGFTLPVEWATTFDWLQDHGYVGEVHGAPYAGVHRPGDGSSSSLAFHPAEPEFMKYWLGNPDVDDQVAVVVRTGGDGSHAALWRDGDGVQRIVHLGSGSGSDAVGVLVDNPVDLLRLMAIGYDELCWPSSHALTPREVFDAEVEEIGDRDGARAFALPDEFRSFVATTFGVTIPERADEVVGDLQGMDDDEAGAADPFCAWLDVHRR